MQVVDRLQKQTSGVLLGVFRILFGILLALHVILKMTSGVTRAVYIEPEFLFPHPGFEWLPRLTEMQVYFAQALLLVLGLFISFGFFFRVSMISFVLLFSYFFFIDLTNYNNHYYLILLLGLILSFTKAGQVLSIDQLLGKNSQFQKVPIWNYALLRFQWVVVYFYAGLAKLNSDWLQGQPMKIWLEGTSLENKFLLLSYAGLIFDLLIGPLLLSSKTRSVALLLAIVFHVSNHFLFQIGIFPWLAMAGLVLFLDPMKWNFNGSPEDTVPSKQSHKLRWPAFILGGFVFFQILFPFRHFLWKGPVAWTLEGYEYSWMMRLNSRSGYTQFLVHTESKNIEVDPVNLVSKVQMVVARSHPQMILQIARQLRSKYEANGEKVIAVTAESQLSLNGRAPQVYVDPEVDLSREPYGLFANRNWLAEPPEN